MAGGSFGDQIREDLSDDAAELVAVPREPAGDYDLWVLGMGGEHEVQIRGVRVHARLRLEAAAREVGDVLHQVGADEIYLFFVDLPVYGLGCGGYAA